MLMRRRAGRGEIQLFMGWVGHGLAMFDMTFESSQRCIDGKSLVPAWVTSFGICLLAGWGSPWLVATGIPRDVVLHDVINDFS